MLDNIRIKPFSSMFARLATMVVIAVVMTCACLSPTHVFASEASVGDGGQGTSTLSVIAKEGEDAGAKPVAGMEFAAYEVARIGENGGYQVLGPFASVDVEFDGEMTTAEMKGLASRLAEIAAKLDPDAKATTSSEGIANLGRLEYGIYLVVQTNAEGDASAYTTSDPYLINVPQPNVDGTITYDVKAYPKFKKLPATSIAKNETGNSTQKPTTDEKKPTQTLASTLTKPTATQTAAPKTGDDSSFMGAAGLALVGLATVLVAAKKRKPTQF